MGKRCIRYKTIVLCSLFIVHCFVSCVKWSKDPFSSPPGSPDRIDNKISNSISINIACYNVSSGINASPERVAKIFIPFRYDVICFTEVPDGDWILRIGVILGMDYYYKSRISSGNEKDKFKAILSKTPISNTNEFMLNSNGWHPASAIKGDIYKMENKFQIITLQIPGSDGKKGSYAQLVAEGIIKKFTNERLIIAGDFGNHSDEPALKIYNSIPLINIWDDIKINIAEESTCCLYENVNKGITDHILYGNIAGAHAIKGGYVDVKLSGDVDKSNSNYYISNHKPVWALLEFAPPKLKKKRE